MRPAARPNRYFYHPLDAILGTEAAVRILRMLILRRGEQSPQQIAAKCSLGRQGTWAALRRLQATGIIEPFGGRTGYPLYRVAPAHRLTPLLTDLFAREAGQG